MRNWRATGFTLIELMIVVAVVGLLAIIAYPSYERYLLRGHRSSAQAFLLDLAQRQEQFLLDRRQYASAMTGLNSLNLPLPPEVALYYTVTLCESNTCPLAWAGGRPAFQAMLAPIPGGRQANDTINNVPGSVPSNPAPSRPGPIFALTRSKPDGP
ncbi:MAG: pilus assembly protein [Rhodocyclaceae bacterium]|nr:pilus assembly protein [Rhodocyclaceae bacterium]